MRHSLGTPRRDRQRARSPHHDPTISHSTGKTRARRTERPDAFLRAVPDAALDLCLILHHSPIATSLDAYQMVLRGFCMLQWPISHATLAPERLDLRLDGVPLAIGQIRLDPEAPCFRPDSFGAARVTARLAHVLDHPDMVLRLRIAASATPEMIAAARHLLFGLTRPKAVLLLPQQLVLSLSEFANLPAEALHPSAPTTPMPRIRSQQRPPRHVRPVRDPLQIVPDQPPPRPSAFRRADPGVHQSTAPDPVDSILAEYHDAQLSDALRAEFRTTANWCWIATRGTKHRIALLDARPCRSDDTRDMLICDAVLLSRHGQKRPHLAPILLATLVALMPLAWHDGSARHAIDPSVIHATVALTPAYSA